MSLTLFGRRAEAVLLAVAAMTLVLAPPPAPGQTGGPSGGATDTTDATVSWRMPPMQMEMPMLPGLQGAVPDTRPFLPGRGGEAASPPEAEPNRMRRLSDGDTLQLTAGLVRRTIQGEEFTLYAYNRQYPGPLLRVPEDATVIVRFHNEIHQPTTVHWHGVRLDNASDGVPDVTQEPVQPGESFTYRVHFKDPGVYWYHPHVKTNTQIDAGLYGNMLVKPPGGDYYNPANREVPLVLDDILIDDDGLIPWGGEAGAPSHALMGRFGNTFLTNGVTDWEISVGRGAVVRYFITNVANTRTFNLRFGGPAVKVVGADISKFQRETFVDNVVAGVAQRYTVEVRYPQPGDYPITNQIQAINHFRGTFYRQVDTLGMVHVDEQPVQNSHGEEFQKLHEHERVQRDIAEFRPHFDRPVDKRMQLTVEVDGLPSSIMRMMKVDTLYFPPVEFNDAMPMMNWLSTGKEVRWILRDLDTGKENTEMDWSFREGEVAKIRITNSAESIHPMNHPIHLHGQRFLVLAHDGEENDNLAWKDTVIVPVGSSVELLVHFSEPGDWLMHCHIAEHVESGMETVVQVNPADGGAEGSEK